MQEDRRNILVIGASGFVGGRLVRALLAEGHKVRGLARDPARVQGLAALGCEVWPGDMLNPVSLQAAMADVQAVYICVHTLSRQPGSAARRRFMELELTGLQNIVAACRMQGVRRLVYLTSLGNTPGARSEWGRERWKAEEYLLHAALDVTVVQPGQIVGVGGMGFDTLLGQAKRPVALMIANGRQRWRNIAADDLVYYLTGVLGDERTYGQRYEVGCDDVLSNDQMVDLAAEVLGRPHPLKLHIPRALLGALAPLIERAGRLPGGALRGFVDGMTTDMVGDPAPLRRLLPRPPLSYRQAVARALETNGG